MANKKTQTAFSYLIKDEKILLLQEGGKRSMGLWSFPGGHVDDGETMEQAAIREAMEESGYKIELEKVIYKSVLSKIDYKGSSSDTEEIEIQIFKGKIISGEMTIDNQALDLKWFDKEAALTLPHRWKFIKDIIKNN